MLKPSAGMAGYNARLNIMATVVTEYILKLDEYEAAALKKILGGMNDDEFAKLGVKGADRRRMSDIWGLLPFEEDE